MIKRIISLSAAILMLLSFAACGENSGDKQNTDVPTTESYIREVKTVVAAVNDVTGFGVSKLAKDRDYAYDVDYYDDAQQVADAIKSGKADIASIGLAKAVELCEESTEFKIISSNNLGSAFILTKGVDVSDFSDLKNNEIYTLENDYESRIFINSLLEDNGVPFDSLAVHKMNSIEELSGAIAGMDKYVLMLTGVDAAKLPADEERIIAVDFTIKWIEQKKCLPIHSVIVARTDYIEANPETIDEFRTFNEVSVNFIISNAEAGAVHLSDYGFFADEETAMMYISGFNSLNYNENEELQKFVNETLEAVGAQKLPDSDFCISK